MPAKSIIATRYHRMKNGIETHRSSMPAELLKLIHVDKLLTMGDKFELEYAKEAKARGEIETVHDERMTEVFELKVAFNLVKNLTEAYVGEHKREDLKKFIKTGKYLEKASYLQNALRADEKILAQVGEHNLEELEKAIREFQDAVATENLTEDALEEADEITDKLVAPLAKALNSTKLFIKAWIYDIDRPELYAEFVKPRARRKKTEEASS